MRDIWFLWRTFSFQKIDPPNYQSNQVKTFSFYPLNCFKGWFPRNHELLQTIIANCKISGQEFCDPLWLSVILQSWMQTITEDKTNFFCGGVAINCHQLWSFNHTQRNFSDRLQSIAIETHPLSFTFGQLCYSKWRQGEQITLFRDHSRSLWSHENIAFSDHLWVNNYCNPAINVIILKPMFNVHKFESHMSEGRNRNFDQIPRICPNLPHLWPHKG